MILHEVPRIIIEHDISVFLRDEFSKVRKRYIARIPSQTLLDNTWPHPGVLEALVKVAAPLFIVAAIICRYIADSTWNPSKRLEKILEIQEKGQLGHLGQMAQTYLPVLSQTFDNPDEEREFYHEFRKVVGSIITLAEPLSTTSLAALLDMDRDVVLHHLYALNSVLVVNPDPEPVRLFHLSFGEFLLSDEIRNRPFGVDGHAIHRLLSIKCLQFLSAENGLQENMCELWYPGYLRKDIDPTLIDRRLSPAFQYACRYWTHHVRHGMVQIRDEDEVHVFLQKHFLHWLEALSLMNKISEAISQLDILQSCVSINGSTHITAILEDARRIVLSNRYIVDLAPLQIYSSAMIFAPRTSVVRKECGRTPIWLRQCPITPPAWGPKLQTLEGHTHVVRSVAFSHDGSLLASASHDKTVKLWDPCTGQEVQTLEGHTNSVRAVAFSHGSSLLASASDDRTIRLWDPNTGQRNYTLEGYTNSVRAVVFSHDSSLLASVSDDRTIRLWEPITGQEKYILKGHIGLVSAVVFSHDSSLLASVSYGTIRIWAPYTGQEKQILIDHTDDVTAVTFSYDGSLLASASNDRTVRLWDPYSGQRWQTLKGHTDCVRAVAFSHDGSLLASGSDDKTIRLWDPYTGQEIQILKGHTGSVRAVAFSHDGSLLASASYDKTVRFWNPRTARKVQTLKGYTGVTTVSFSADDTALLTNRGMIPINAISITCPKAEPSNRECIAMKQAWIQRGDYDLLWLPTEYRVGPLAFYGETIAIGLNSSKVRFIQFVTGRQENQEFVLSKWKLNLIATRLLELFQKEPRDKEYAHTPHRRGETRAEQHPGSTIVVRVYTLVSKLLSFCMSVRIKLVPISNREVLNLPVQPKRMGVLDVTGHPPVLGGSLRSASEVSFQQTHRLFREGFWPFIAHYLSEN